MNNIIKKIICSILLLTALQNISFAQPVTNQFVVRDIRIEGLQRIKPGTVLNYLPIKEGNPISEEHTTEIIQTLYNTGFFEHVELGRQGDILIIKVLERPTIGNLSFSGNKDIATERFTAVLKQIGLVRGEIYQKTILVQFEQELRKEYTARGKYNAIITSTVTPIGDNRVDIKIDISEGRPAKVREIKIIGNESFSHGELVKNFNLATGGILDFFTKKTLYSKEKLDASLEELRSFYLDRGYLKFQIESANVSLSPDQKEVYIVIKIIEGPKYYFDGFELVGQLILPKEELIPAVMIKPGKVFSRKIVTESAQQLGELYGNYGYGFPTIQPEPTINEETKRVFITYYISPGEQVYVRRINFRGNTKTADYVLRNAVRQPEGALLSLKEVRESERQLRVLSYLQNVQVQTVPVPGTSNQVDLDFTMTEGPTAEAKAMIGYGSLGPELSLGLNQYNFLGTGRTIGGNFNINRLYRNVTLNYFNPFFTNTGIGQGFNVYYQKYTPGQDRLANYAADRIGGSIYWSIPVSDWNALQFGTGFEHLQLSVGDNPSVQIANFVANHGESFNQFRLNAGWTFSNLDRLPFPTQGFNHQVTANVMLPADKRSLSYYKLGYIASLYQPLFSDFVLWLSGAAGYGNQFKNGDHNGLPFYENYFVGGIVQPGQVRGYENFTLGPRDTDARGIANRPLGGNYFVSGSVALVLPYPLSRETIRSSAFFDFGNVYSQLPLRFGGTPAGPIRTSVGIALDWRSPFGPLTFSLARPLNAQSGSFDESRNDQVRYFQFSVMSSTGVL